MLVGAGGIVSDAHLPTYRKVGFELVGITNRTRARAETLATAWGILHVYDSVADAPADAVHASLSRPSSLWPP